MSFFQNPFNADFIGVWVLGDRHHNLDFKVPQNTGRGDTIITSWAEGPYDMSGVDVDGNDTDELTIIYAIDKPYFRKWAALTINVASGAADPTAVTVYEIISNLNANTTFSGLFRTALNKFNNGDPRLTIESLRDSTSIKFYIGKYETSGGRPYFSAAGGAETLLKFNYKAGVAECPSYFERHTIDNRYDYDDAQNMLIFLDAGVSLVDDDIIDNAVNEDGISLNYDSSNVQEDWQLLRGRSGIFEFTKYVSGAAPAAKVEIVYPAGAMAGDLATKIIIDGSGNEFHIPYTLQSGDLITPP